MRKTSKITDLFAMFINNETLQIYFRFFIILIAFFSQNLLTEIIAWLIAITVSLNIWCLIKRKETTSILDTRQIIASIIIIVSAVLNIGLRLAYLTI